MTHLSDDDLVLHFYGEADAPSGVREHLAGCDDCRRRNAELEQMMRTIDDPAVPERDDSYGREVWARLQPALEAERARKASWFRGWFTLPRLAMAGALATLLIAAFVAGRYTRLPGEAPVGAPANGNGGPQRVLLIAVSDHLERSAMVLAEISNLDGGPTVDISAEQAVADDLVASNRIYRQVALRSNDPGIAGVLDDLERVLIEIANSPSEMSSDELQQIRSRIESQGLLFKVRVLGSKVRQDAAVPPQHASS